MHQNRASRSRQARRNRPGSVAGGPEDHVPEVAIGLGLGHPGGRPVHRIPPGPLVSSVPDLARRAVQDLAVVGLVIPQGQGVTAVRGRPDGLAHRSARFAPPTERARPSSRDPSSARARTAGGVFPARRAGPPRRRACLPASRLGRQSAASPRQTPPFRLPGKPGCASLEEGEGHQECAQGLGHHESALPDEHGVAGHDHRGGCDTHSAQPPPLGGACRQGHRCGAQRQVEQGDSQERPLVAELHEGRQEDRIEGRPIGGRPAVP